MKLQKLLRLIILISCSVCIFSLNSSKIETIYTNRINTLKINSDLYYNQEAFSFDIDHDEPASNGHISLDRYCEPVKVKWEINPIGIFYNEETYYREPHLYVYSKYVYLIDISQNLRVFYIDEATDALISQINEIKLDFKKNQNNYVSFFARESTQELMLLVDNNLMIFSIKDPGNPSLLNNLLLHELAAIEAMYSNDNNCLYILQEKLENIAVYCFSNSISQITDIFYLNTTFLSNISKQNITKINDLAVYKSLLFLSEPNLGLIVLNIAKKEEISLILFDSKTYIHNITIFENSLAVVRVAPSNENKDEEVYFEEYFVGFSSNGDFIYKSNRKLKLNSSDIIDFHISNRFMFILQDNQIKTFLHSIPSQALSDSDDYLTSFYAKDIMALNNINDLVVVITGDRIIIHKVQQLFLKFICNLNDSLATNARYQINFKVYTSTCRFSNESILFEDVFRYCVYKNHINVLVKSNKEEISAESINAGIIAGIVVFVVFFIIMIFLFAHYYGSLKEKLLKLKQMKYDHLNMKEDISERK